MDFQLDDVQQQIRDMTQDFAAKQVRPIAAELDEASRFPDELVKGMAELGLLGMMVGEEWGGTGVDTVSYAIALENISWGCASTGVIMSVNNSLYCDPVLRRTRPTPKRRRFLRPVCRPAKRSDVSD